MRKKRKTNSKFVVFTCGNVGRSFDNQSFESSMRSDGEMRGIRSDGRALKREKIRTDGENGFVGKEIDRTNFENFQNGKCPGCCRRNRSPLEEIARDQSRKSIGKNLLTQTRNSIGERTMNMIEAKMFE